ncbi:MAG: hypothetical protein ACJAUL_001295 [Paraglaciecola sp.]|jgi:hypothetical protein
MTNRKYLPFTLSRQSGETLPFADSIGVQQQTQNILAVVLKSRVI